MSEGFDVTGLLCPLPVLKIRKRMASMAPGELLEVVASDPATEIDIPHYCVEAGHELVAHSVADGVFRFTIRRG